MNIVCYRHGKSQNRRNHQHGAVDIHLGETCDAECQHHAADHSEKRTDDATQRTGHQQHHDDAYDGGNHHQSSHLLSDVRRLLLCHIRHTCGARMQRGVFLFRDDTTHLLTCHDVRRHVACLFPLFFRREGTQLQKRPGVLSVFGDELTRDMGLAISKRPDLLHLWRPGLWYLVWDYLYDFHPIVRTQHKLKVNQRSDLIGIRKRVEKLVA